MGKKRENYVGREFGKLTVISILEENNGKNEGGLYGCKCKCGNEIESFGYRLHWKNSCGCLVSEARRVMGLKKRKPEKVTETYEYLTYKSNCRTRNYIPLSKKEWLKIVYKPCYYCGDIDKRNRATMNNYKQNNGVTLTEDIIKQSEIEINGIDRLNNNLGYVNGNIVSCCGMCNKMKNSFESNSFFDKIKKIYKIHC
jgi:hypothetical protein